MNYWLACGLLVLGVGVLLHATTRGTRKRIRRDGLGSIDTANSIRAVGLGYVLSAMGALLVVIGSVDTLW